MKIDPTDQEILRLSLEESEKTGTGQENSRKYLPSGEKIVKIGPLDTEIALLIVKKNKLEMRGKA